MNERDPAKAHVLAALARHVGRAQGVAAHPLAEIIGITERRLRACISLLREEGVAVCGHPRSGYFIAATADELDESCRFLRSRALHSLVLEARLRKIPFADLVGQLHLPT